MVTFASTLRRLLAVGLVILATTSSYCAPNKSKIVHKAKVIKYQDIPTTTHVKRRIFDNCNSDALLGAVAIYKINDNQALLQMVDGEWCIKWIDLNTGDTHGVIRTGRGPGEMLDAGVAGIITEKDGTSKVTLYSLGSEVAVTVLISNTSDGWSCKEESRIHLPHGTMYALSHNNGLYCYVFSSDNLIGWYLIDKDKQEEVIRPFGASGRVEDTSNYFAATAIDTSNNRLIMGMTSFPRLYIFDLENASNPLSINLDSESDKSILTRLKSKNSAPSDWCVSATTASNSIYILTVDSSGVADEFPKETIWKYSLDGRLLSKWTIPDFIVNFMVKDSGKSIIAITINGELVEYSF